MNTLLKKWITCSVLIVKALTFSSQQLSAENQETDVAQNEVFIDYQNYNHGYCSTCDCNPCQCSNGACPAPVVPAPVCAPCQAPCAPVCGTACGISICALGVGIAALITAAVIIVSSGNGSAHS